MTITTVAPTPTTSGAATSATKTDILSGQKTLTTSYDTFLKLLTTQLQHQDPTSPLDTNAFTAQLVSMTGVQQQLLSNQLLQQLVGSSQGGQGVAGAVGLIGKTVTADSAAATLSGGHAGWTYHLAAPAQAATLALSNASGQVVWSGAAPSLGAGDHAFSWNGKDAGGVQRPDGDAYTLKVAAVDAAGGAIASTVSVQGQVTGVSETNGQTLVSLGATQAPLSAITGVQP